MSRENTYLIHYGILGQKWGIRRFQNSDGSLTSEGKKRYGSGKATSEMSYNINPRDVRKNMDSMTDAELQRAINRINMQQQVERLSPNIVEKGRKRAQQVVRDVALATAFSAAAAKIAKLYSRLVLGL